MQSKIRCFWGVRTTGVHLLKIFGTYLVLFVDVHEWDVEFLWKMFLNEIWYKIFYIYW